MNKYTEVVKEESSGELVQGGVPSVSFMYFKY